MEGKVLDRFTNVNADCQKKKFLERFNKIYPDCQLYCIQLNGFSHTVFYKDKDGNWIGFDANFNKKLFDIFSWHNK